MIFRVQMVLEIDTRQHDTRIINQQILDVTPKAAQVEQPVQVRIPSPLQGRIPDKKPRKTRSDKGVSRHEKTLAIRPQYQSFSFPQ